MTRFLAIPNENNILDDDKNAIYSLTKVQNDERKRIAQGLHDGLGYLSSTIKLNLTSLKTKVDTEDREVFLSNYFHLLEESLQAFRVISNNLSPNCLIACGLIMATKRFTNTLNLSIPFRINFISDNSNLPLRKDFERKAFKIIQELMNNAIKHSQSSYLNLQIKQHKDQLIIQAEDFGKGIDNGGQMESLTYGKGFSSMLDQVSKFDGKMEVDSSRSGTTVTLMFPTSSIFTSGK